MKANWPALVLCCLLPALPTWGQGANVYLAQADAGAHDGSNCANAHVYSWFNSAGNWGTGGTQIGPGTTVHLCGTFTGTANSTELTFQGSGTAGNPITLLFEPGAVLTAPYWATSGAINPNGKSYLVISGDATGGHQGIIENSDNGTQLAYQAYSRGINADATSNVTIQNLTIENIYVRTRNVNLASISSNGATVTVTCAANCGVHVGNSYGIWSTTDSAINSAVATWNGSAYVCAYGSPNPGLYCNVAVVATTPDATHFTYSTSVPGANSGTGGFVEDGVLNNNFWNAVFFGNNTSSNITIKNVLAHDLSWVFPGWGNGITIEYSEIYNADHGTAWGTNVTQNGPSIHDNYFHDFALWDSPGGNQNHHDYIHLWDLSSGTCINGTQIYNNRFDGDFGHTTTAFMFLQGALCNTAIYNNVGITGAPNFGKIAVHADTEGFGGSGLSIYNNYFDAGANTTVGSPIVIAGTPNVTILNNVLVGGQSVIGLSNGTTISTVCGFSQCVDYNVYEDLHADYADNLAWQFHGSYYTSLSAWRTGCACDANAKAGTLASLLLNAMIGQPMAGSPATAAGLNLTSLGILPLDFDTSNGGSRTPDARPRTGKWDAGAYLVTTPMLRRALPPLNLVLAAH